jgi:multidrug efflux pump subunit AcrA (membrane-fusion protein)
VIRVDQRGLVAAPSSSGGQLLRDARTRPEYFDIPSEEIRRIEETGKVKKVMTISSPASGVVVRKDVFGGQRVTPAMGVFRIADLGTVWIAAMAYESDLPYLREGQPADVVLDSLPGKRFDAKVDFIYPYLHGSTREVPVRIVIQNPDRLLKPSMYEA